MSQMNILPILAFFLILQIFGCSQKGFYPGYIVHHSGDTLSGLVKERDADQNSDLRDYIKFRGGKMRKRTYEPGTIAGYGVRGDSYRSAQLTVERRFFNLPIMSRNGWVFLRIIEDGYLTLYGQEFIDEDGNRDMAYFLRRDDEVVFTPVNLLFFKKRMSEYFSDSRTFKKDIQQRSYRFADISRLVRDYNEWMREQ